MNVAELLEAIADQRVPGSARIEIGEMPAVIYSARTDRLLLPPNDCLERLLVARLRCLVEDLEERLEDEAFGARPERAEAVPS